MSLNMEPEIMKKAETVFRRCLSLSAVAALVCSLSPLSTSAASYEWTFNTGDLASSLGNGAMAYADVATPGLTSFGATDGSTVPHIGGIPANYLHVSILPALANGYLLTFNDTAPNGGGSYVNQYTVVMDILRPTPLGSYAAIFQTNPGNSSGNDADFYLHSNGGIGIGTYSSAGTIAPNVWNRVAFVLNVQSGVTTNISFFVNGTQVHGRAADALDGRWSLYSNLDAGADLFLFNEGDTSGNYTGEWYVNSIAFVDRNLSAAELLGLGGAKAEGILVPEPATLSLVALGLLAVASLRARRAFPAKR